MNSILYIVQDIYTNEMFSFDEVGNKIWKTHDCLVFCCHLQHSKGDHTGVGGMYM